MFGLQSTKKRIHEPFLLLNTEHHAKLWLTVLRGRNQFTSFLLSVLEVIHLSMQIWEWQKGFLWIYQLWDTSSEVVLLIGHSWMILMTAVYPVRRVLVCSLFWSFSECDTSRHWCFVIGFPFLFLRCGSRRRRCTRWWWCHDDDDARNETCEIRTYISVDEVSSI